MTCNFEEYTYLIGHDRFTSRPFPRFHWELYNMWCSYSIFKEPTKHTATVAYYVHRSNKWSDYPTAAPSGPFRFEMNSSGNIKLRHFSELLIRGSAHHSACNERGKHMNTHPSSVRNSNPRSHCKGHPRQYATYVRLFGPESERGFLNVPDSCDSIADKYCAVVESSEGFWMFPTLVTVLLTNTVRACIFPGAGELISGSNVNSWKSRSY
jgi:hypothetical protein